MAVSVGREHIEALARDGAVCLRQAFERRWLDTVARGIEAELKAPGTGFVEQAAGLPGRFVTDYCAAQRIGEFQDFILHSPAAEMAGRLMGASSARFLMDVLWIKEPGTTKPTAWHQDQPYFCVDGLEMCSIWLPVDPVPAAVALRFIRGSHRWDKWYRPQLTSGKELYSFADSGSKWETIPDFDAELDKHEILSWDLAPGDCLVFHALTANNIRQIVGLMLSSVRKQLILTRRAIRRFESQPQPRSLSPVWVPLLRHITRLIRG